LGRAWFADDFAIDETALAKNLLKHPGLKEWLPRLADRLENLPELSHGETERVCREFAEELGVKPGVLVNGARAVITGQVKGPSMFEVFAQIGKQRVVSRLRDVAKYFA
jgi:glutamyl-tRNA synthetase